MLLLSILSIIFTNAFILKRDYSILLSRITLSVLLVTFLLNYNSTHFNVLEKGLAIYNGLYQCSANTQIFNLFVILLSFFILSMTSYYPRKAVRIVNGYAQNYNEVEAIDKTSKQFKILEYSLITLFILSGSIFLISSNDIISIFISIELQSYGLYLLSSIYRSSELSTKAGLTYFLLGGLSSCIILLSKGLLYINSGNTSLENIYVICNVDALNNKSISLITDNVNNYFNNLSNIYTDVYINTCFVILSVGLLFKVSAAPFHFWSPDVYDGVPTLVTTFIAIIAKISIFVLLLELVHFTTGSNMAMLSYSWDKNLLLSSLISLIIGTILGLTQSRIKRLYAYSTISHVGFILLALSINTTESIQAFMFYLIQYSISNLNAFLILISVGYILLNYFNNDKQYDKLAEKNNSPIQLISQIKGLYKLNILLALSFSISLFSFLGVPPLLGFFGKQMVLSAAIDNGYIFVSLIAILTSVISAAYYLVLVKQIFFDESKYENIFSKNGAGVGYIVLSSNLTVLISVFTLITVMFIFVPNESLNVVKILSLFISSV